jgi:hypothetical protein
MTITPAYGRDYKSAAAVKKDWKEGKDFMVADIFGGQAGRYINRNDAEAGMIVGIMARYDTLRKVVCVC